MRLKRNSFRIMLPALMLLLSCGKCQGRSQDATKPESLAAHQGSTVSQPGRESSDSDGGQRLEQQIDSNNRYLAAVMVTTNALMTEGGEVECSGVLIAPRVVLTAASCVCTEKQPSPSSPDAKVEIDTSACTASTGVTVARYESPTREGGFRAASVELGGRVRPHPRFKMILSGDGAVMSSTADLAVVFLEEGVKGATPLRLAETETRAGETLLTVGYPRDIDHGGIHRKRRFGKGEVIGASVTNEGVFLVRPPGQRTDAGMNGGPCLRETASGTVLAGILRGGTSEHYLLTSTQPYKEWLLEQLHQGEDSGD